MVTSYETAASEGVLPRGFCDPAAERLRTVPNVVTVVRTTVALVVGAVAVADHSLVLIIIGYACYWSGDSLDGFLARRLRQETRIGAVADIGADRLCTIMLGIALITTVPWTLLPVLIFLGQFVLVDSVLSLGFLHWRRLLSPNYFYLVDRTLWRLNWSHPAKATNTSSVIIVTAISHSAIAGAVMAGSVLVVKIISLARIYRVGQRPLTLPVPAATAG